MGAPVAEIRRTVPRLGLNRSELAESIGFSPTSIDEMVKEGVLPPPRIWRTRKVWRVAEVEAYMANWPNEKGDQQTEESDAGQWRAS